MRYSYFTIIAVGAGLVAAVPTVEKRTTTQDFNAPPGGDVAITNYALTLEYLERKFYQEGLANYTRDQFVAAGFPDPFYDNLKEIYYDEKVHVDILSGALKSIGAKAVTEAKYKFGVTNARSFVTLSSVLEGVGVSAYLGAAAALVDDAYLTLAGSILSVEARHSSYIRAALKQSPFPKPFDTPLDFNQVFSLAAQFITAFSPGDPALPFKAFPPLALEATQYDYVAGSSPVTFKNAYANALKAHLVQDKDTPVYAVFFSGLDVYYSKVRVTRGDKDYKIDAIPTGANGQLPPTGQVYVILSKADGVTVKTSDEKTISGVAILEVLPPKGYKTV